MLTFIVPYRATDQPERAQQLQTFSKAIHKLCPEALVFVMEQAGDRPVVKSRPRTFTAQSRSVLHMSTLTGI